jgi:adenylosuccinate synthase
MKGKVAGVFDCDLGDSGKGKIVDYLLDSFDIAAKGSGGCNTGASVEVEGKRYKFHHLPVSVLRNKPSYLASPCLLYLPKLREELEYARSLGMNDDNLRISPKCHVITEDHVARDCAAESSGGIGSTKRGISPCSSDKYARKGVRLEEFPEFSRYFADVAYELNRAIDSGRSVLFAGTQGFWLDPESLTYPYVSTTSVTSASMCASGIPPTKIDEVIGVFKAYSTYVGTGPYLTEVQDATLNEYIVQKGHEFGTTTGRKRRVGYLNLPALKHACMVNGCTSIALTKADVLVGQKVKYCVAYELDGQVLDHVPMLKEDYWRVNPIYEELEVKTGREFIPVIEQFLGTKVKYFSYGPNRHEIEEL